MERGEDIFTLEAHLVEQFDSLAHTLGGEEFQLNIGYKVCLFAHFEVALESRNTEFVGVAVVPAGSTVDPELAQLCPGVVADLACAICCAIDCVVVHAHQHSIFCHLYIGLHAEEVGDFASLTKCERSVLGVAMRESSVRLKSEFEVSTFGEYHLCLGCDGAEEGCKQKKLFEDFHIVLGFKDLLNRETDHLIWVVRYRFCCIAPD